MRLSLKGGLIKMEEFYLSIETLIKKEKLKKEGIFNWKIPI